VDPTVVEAARNGDREAYERLAREAAGRLYPLAYRIVRDRDLADALQRTLVAIWQELAKLRDPARFEAWTYRILLRLCQDELKRRRRLGGQSRGSEIEERARSGRSCWHATRGQCVRSCG
jgi:DNA-directed RNA polymerase specialized sigma24 family protein